MPLGLAEISRSNVSKVMQFDPEIDEKLFFRIWLRSEVK